MADRDEQLLAALARADAAAFDAIYERYRAPLYSFLVRLCGQSDLARDLLQETWLRLARHATTLPAGTDLRAWLFTVARNLAASQRRWTLLDRRRLAELGLWPRAELESPFERLAASRTEARLERAIAQLPVKYREALLLVSSGFAPADAARVVGTTPDALRQRLARARAMIRERLDLCEATS